MDLLIFFFLVTVPRSGVLSEVVLTQSEAVLKKPGESHELTCAVTGLTLSSAWMNWIRQKPGSNIMYPVITIMNSLLSILFCLVAMPKWTVADIQLVSSGPGTLRPGETLRMACKVTGVSISDSGSIWNWVRQPPGKGLEWIARIYPKDGRKWYSSSLQSRTTISSENSKNEFSLQLNTLTADDSAMYYCARESTVSQGVLSQVVLTQSEAAMKKPGESHTLTCTIAGFDLSSTWMNRMSQKTRKGLEWLLHY
ncbi:immunoglobulin alpha-2 heavy chain-like [Elgaria multicarinata webbii]|uniref:immunoglobulin alpha-2 heavy chain-like n=1 Tax=Elgaria multicarinata webbii TaxID=159646 RepID=UPI002FCD1F20